MSANETSLPTGNSTAKFWDRIAESYAKKPVADEQAYQTKLRVTRDYLDTDMNVLEFGCGTGSTAIAHAPYVNHLLAIDISSKMIDIARGKAEAGNITNLDFLQATIDEFDAPEESFDAVLGLSILHLLEDKDAAIAKVYSMLKPGGAFISSTVCLGDGLSFFKYITPVGRFLGLLPILKVFTANDVLDSLRRHGFEIEHQWQPGKNKGIFIVATKPG